MLYRIKEAMRLLSVSRATIYRMIDRGDLITIKLGSATRVTADSLDRVAARPKMPNDPPVCDA